MTKSTQYLAFQCFIGTPSPAIPISANGMQALSGISNPASLESFVRGVVKRIGDTGRDSRRLAVIFGPIAFDHSDAEVASLIDSAFVLALARNVAVGFHLDDSMFWARRSDLWRDPASIEWLDWAGTPNTGRRVEWGPRPSKLPPQMCFNSPAIQAEVRRRGTRVIGKAIQENLDRLRRAGKPDLFAGVIAGWETQIGRDFDTGKFLGYHALRNRGFSRIRPPRDPDAARETVVQEFITLWCKSLADAGLPAENIYSHTAFFPKATWDRSPDPAETYSERNQFAPPPTAIGPYRRPGFSTYPQSGLCEQIYDELARRGQQGWASAEGTNMQPDSGPGQSGMNMETYLAKMFNHGATLVDIFGWGIGGDVQRNNPFRLVAEGDDSVGAYRKFLAGAPLVEGPPAGLSIQERLPAKIHRIQQELPAWVQRTGNQAQAQPLMQQLDAALKAHDLPAAERAADAILKLLPPP